MSKTKDVLLRAKEILLTKGWAKGFYARDSDNRACSVYNPEACKYCLLGAIHVATSEITFDQPYSVTRDLVGNTVTLLESKLHTIVPTFNDDPNTTLESVVSFIDRVLSEEETT